MMNNAEKLLLAYDDLSWESYVELSDRITNVDLNNIEKELVAQASVYSYYGGLYAMSKRDLDDAQLEFDQFVAQTKTEERESRLANGQKTTEKALDEFIQSHPKYKTVQQTVTNARYKRDLLKNLLSSLEQKASMIQQVSANSRAEAKVFEKF